MGLLMATEAGPVWSGQVLSCPVCSGRWGGRRGLVDGRGRSAWAEHGPVRDESGRCLLPVGWSGLSGELSDVRRTPSLVAWSALIVEVGIPAEGRELEQRVWCLEEDTEACRGRLDGFWYMSSQKSTAATQLVAR